MKREELKQWLHLEMAQHNLDEATIEKLLEDAEALAQPEKPAPVRQEPEATPKPIPLIRLIYALSEKFPIGQNSYGHEIACIPPSVWVTVKRSVFEIDQNWQKYTTSSPQRKPLTDEQIKDISESIWGSELDYRFLAEIKFARAIEAAHGIKDKQ